MENKTNHETGHDEIVVAPPAGHTEAPVTAGAADTQVSTVGESFRVET